MDNLNYKERRAIEMKYLGYTHNQIAEEIETPVNTVTDWFRSKGKLFQAYTDFVAETNERRQKEMEQRIALQDDEIFIITTNIAKTIAKDNLEGREVPLVIKGEPVLDEEGKPIMIRKRPYYTVADFERVWKMQRVMQGKPISIEKQDIDAHVTQHDEVVRALGLTDEDFTDERFEQTTKRIAHYLSSGTDLPTEQRESVAEHGDEGVQSMGEGQLDEQRETTGVSEA